MQTTTEKERAAIVNSLRLSAERAFSRSQNLWSYAPEAAEKARAEWRELEKLAAQIEGGA